MSAQAVGVDVGGTKATVVRIDADGSVVARERSATPAEDVPTLLETMRGGVAAVWDGDVVAIGVGAAGIVERGTGRVRYAPNIAWREVDLGTELAGFDVPVHVDNDCTVATVGELLAGAGRGVGDFLYVGVGTGVGGGIVSNGQVARGAHGFAGEIGHIAVEPGGVRCGCGQIGCWETVASGSAIDRLAAERIAPDADGRDVVRLAREGDPTALALLSEVGGRLGEGIGGLVNVLDPSLVILGGGAAIGAGDLLLEPARASAAEAIEGGPHRPAVPLVPAALGEDGAAVGAALWARGETVS
jgi:glucokinase